jgi:AcrR family transcriptional regulator
MSIAYDENMSPAPARTSNEAIISAARAILEADGLSALTMRRVAEAVGVKGPSLYKRIPDREALLRAVADGVVEDLARAIAQADATDDPRRDLEATVVAYRAFVRQNPNGYLLLFAELPSGARPDRAILAALGVPLVRAVSRLAGEESALEGARTIVAWAHGFVTMELAGAFRLGGDLDAAYAFGVRAIIAGVSGLAFPASG